MLRQYKLNSSSSLNIECDQFENSWHLQSKVLKGAQGLFNDYNEYVNTVNLLNALKAGDKKRFKILISEMNINNEYLINVNSNNEPRNPYATIQLGGGSQNKTLLEVARAYNKLEIIQLLEEEYSAPEKGKKSKTKM